MDNAFGVWLNNNGTLVLQGYFDNPYYLDEIKKYSNNPEVKKVLCRDNTRFFGDCSYLFENFQATEIDVTAANWSKVTNMQGMFTGCTELTTLHLKGIDTSNVINMSFLFGGCESLTNLDVTGFDTSSVEDMGGMFFSDSNLTELDLSSFDTKKVENTSYMFCGCEGIKSIYASDAWDMSSVKYSECMFLYCYKLVGGNSTAYDENKVDVNRALIDKKVQTGYLTEAPVRLSEPKYKQTADKDGVHYVRYVFVVPKSELDGKSKAAFTANYDGAEKELETDTYYTGMTTNGKYYRPDSFDKVMFVVTITGVSAENESKLDCNISLK